MYHLQMCLYIAKACWSCRVYYSSSEKPEEVWAELADGSCRWRQTGSEIKIICLKVSPNGSPDSCPMVATAATHLRHWTGIKSCSVRSALLGPRLICSWYVWVAALMQVPSEMSSKDLDVSLQPFNIRIAHRLTNEVPYLLTSPNLHKSSPKTGLYT